MPIPQLLSALRHDTEGRALITLAGEIDMGSEPRLREALDRCLRDGIRVIDVDLTAVSFCDCSGLNAFLRAAQRTAALGGSLRLHHPRPMLVRLFVFTHTDSHLLVLPVDGEYTCAAVDLAPARPKVEGRRAPVPLAETDGAR
ncbi:STAS domain-containing protein [Streptomyces sp. 7N604]|uniref:STAS domain-containing protein n=1 Tax=Streptomyces sp. 7N604 TaxID=3457415 RepID=UPI003FCF6BB2